ncbi:alkaline phosphatase family protein [Thermococcus sp. EP1]|uniref:alkaline phosphatase family protein n=1 Tax=Thermococcus sp. EP1 TaxID=1591054 RepID=UPI0006DBDB78|nr:alkaline phosphatase family protein [Thermococcus sp. EP1]
MRSNLKIAIIGLDGANKTTAKAVGIKTQLHDFISTIPPYTPPSWISIITGVNPAKHGIIGWQKVNPFILKTHLTTAKDVKYPRLPELLSLHGLKSVIINLPMTWPMEWADPETNVVVSDWAAPKQEIFPKDLNEKYKDRLVEPPHQWAKEDKKEYPNKVKEFTETRLSLYYELLEKIDWNLYFIVFSETDWISHLYPQILEGKEISIVKPTFRLINKFIKDVTSIADIVFIVSDHGFEIINKVFYVNEALAEKGFIKYSTVKSKIASKAKEMIPKQILNRIIEKTRSSGSIVSHVASNADAFMVEPPSWGIYLKDPQKSKAIIDALRSYSEVRDAIPLRLIHKGPHVKYLPDLFVIPESGVEFSHEFKGKIAETVHKGGHEIHGVFSVWGEDIKETIKFDKIPRVYDIVSTVLHIFGLPIPKDSDGRVLREIFEEESEFAKRIPKYTNEFQPRRWG